MFQFYSLFSSSSGNSLLVTTENTKILIDAGESARKIADILFYCKTSIQEIDAIVVSHEHIDHVKGLGTLSKKYNIPVYANDKTWNAMPAQAEKIIDENKKFFVPNEEFEIGDICLHPFSTPHDAASSCGFTLKHHNKKIGIATDLGHVSSNIMTQLEGSNFLFLESNYEPEVLKCSRYPYPLKQRIAGPNGHLSNEDAGKLISYLLTTDVRKVMLGHLSKENNFPELAYKTVLTEVLNSTSKNKKFSLDIANDFSYTKSIRLE